MKRRDSEFVEFLGFPVHPWQVEELTKKVAEAKASGAQRVKFPRRLMVTAEEPDMNESDKSPGFTEVAL